jgi:TolB-like protein/class 3 adenylate cyclase
MHATRQLAAIMFTDMVGYTALMQQNEQLAIQKRDRHKKIFDNSLVKHEGRLLMYYGDGALSIFTSGLNAVKSAVEIQTLNLQEPKIDVRIGLHIGDVMFDDTGIYGDSVNVASRIESLATPGGVFLSEKLYDEIKNYEGITAKSLGYFELKNVNQPMQVYAITNPGIVIPSREEMRGKTKERLNGVAVLPFASLSSDPENEFFCDGVTEELINVLSKIEGLQVISRTSAFAFKGKNEDVREIAAKLNVQKIIEGSVRKAGNRIRVTAQLINAADGYHFWSETYDRSLEDIFEIQDDIARAIANKMRENLNTEQHQSQLAKASTQNLEAYKKYLQAGQFYNRASPDDRMRAIDLLNEAIRLDPNMTDALAMLSFIHSFFAQSGQMEAHEAELKAGDYARKAMQKDPENPNALIAMSLLKLYLWEWDECRLLNSKAKALSPNNPFVLQVNCEYNLVFMNDEQIVEDAHMIHRLDPLSAVSLGQSARYLGFLGRYDEALVIAEQALEIDERNIGSRNAKALSLAQKGDLDEAIAVAKESQRMAGNFLFVLLTMACIYSMRGETDKASEILVTLEKMQQDNPATNFDFALAVAALYAGQKEKFHKYYDIGLQKKSLLLLQIYGSTLMRDAWFDEHVVESRKKLGLPVKSGQ